MLTRRNLMENKKWKLSKSKMFREFNFPDFKTALEFVDKAGEISEKENHHPEIFLSWGKVKIELFTHERKKITEKDINLSLKINKIYKEE